jgi:kynureninase
VDDAASAIKRRTTLEIDPLLRWREEFPILDTCTYLISNSLGAMPRAVYTSLTRYADTWSALGVNAWGESFEGAPNWWELNGVVGDRIAPLIGAPGGSVLIHQNASIANSILFSALDFSDTRRNRFVVTAMDFPSDVYVLRQWLPPHSELVVIPSQDGITIDDEALLAAIDERTRLVSVPHVLFRSAYILPAAAITARAREVGAQVLFNGYHSAGVIPVDVSELGVDFYIGGTLKWLCGGPGGVFLYVRPDLLRALTPRVTGWFAHRSPFTFDLEHLDLRDDAYRLMNGTPGIASLYAIQPGVEIINTVGVDAIRQKSQRQTARLVALADEFSLEVVSPRDPERRAGTVTVRPPAAHAVSRELIARGFRVDYRQGAGIRIAPHFYTTDAEVEAVMRCIGEVLADGSWKRHDTDGDFVT